LIKEFTKATVTIRFFTDTYSRLDDAFNFMINSFNRYANETNKDIQLQLTYFTDVSNVVGYNDYSSTLGLLGKKNSKYDIFAYDANYLSAFSPYLMELDEYLPKNFTDLYSSKNNRMLNYYNGHIRGFLNIFIYY